MRHLPNIISFARIILVFPTAYFLSMHQYIDAMIVFFIAGLSDGLDGFLARRYSWQSKLGAIVDPIGDKLLMMTTYFMLGYLQQLSIALVILVIARDLIIVIGAIVYRVLFGHIEMKPMLLSKINTACQILLVGLFIYKLSELPYSDLISLTILDAIVYIVFVTTSLSGLAYIVVWWKKSIEVSSSEKLMK